MNARQFQLLYRLESRHWWYQSTHRLIVDALHSRCSQIADIVDVGCGTGGLLPHLSRLAPVTGIEPDPLAFRLAQRRSGKLPNVKVLHGDIQSLDIFPDTSLDCITCIDVLYHRQVRSWRGALRTFHRKLRPGGALVLQVAAFPCLSGAHDIAVNGARRFEREPLEHVLRRIGWTVELCSHRFSWLFPGLWAVRNWTQRGEKSPAHRNDLTRFSRIPAVFRDTAQKALLGIALAENQWVLRGACLPIGSSLFILARKPSGSVQMRESPADSGPRPVHGIDGT
jgi:SAM-dependent methyltransferase